MEATLQKVWTKQQICASVEAAQPQSLTQDLEQAERNLIAALYSIWHLTGKDKKIVTVKRK